MATAGDENHENHLFIDAELDRNTTEKERKTQPLWCHDVFNKEKKWWRKMFKNFFEKLKI
jgi:hypothetical protein